MSASAPGEPSSESAFATTVQARSGTRSGLRPEAIEPGGR